MLIDWFTVGAQALNFLILVWLLKRFLYKPIMTAIDTREARIRKERADADAIKADAETARDTFQKMSADFEQARAGLLQQATDDATAERQRLMAEAHSAADALAAQRAKALQTEAQALATSITDRARDEVFAVARKTLNDLADVRLEDRICDTFVHRIQASGDQPDSALSTAIRGTSEPIPVRSAFDLSPEQHAAIRSALHDTFSTDAELTFETAPRLIAGIELTAGGQKLAWSISDYLSSLKASVGETFSARDASQAGPTADADRTQEKVSA
ncbi:F0F1 ATP synthase subunit delta [Rhodospira trueperi]|uniref:ATP synthase subunit b n=1 Tax=Rhodospira trueperi TaxID=69960 RepID=A0A1G7I7C6_9PROT|nr:F0F1 ATP synthase subunit delta [Rhodospira trueperi]SDF08269.1 F-type H+-transporting ATPase subunit b [Rhodospira trueperi]